jgi:hypothetical protein
MNKAKNKCLKSLNALHLELPAAIVDDVKRNVMAALEEAEENGKSFARYCSEQGLMYHRCVGNWDSCFLDKAKTTDELYDEFIKSKPK